MKRQFLLIALLATVLVTFAAYKAASQAVSSGNRRTPVPLTAATIETQYDAAGTKLSADIWTLSVSASGSFVEAHESHDGTPIGPKRIILDVKNSQRISIDPTTESRTTYPLSQKAIDTTLNVRYSCSDDGTAEHKTLLGRRAVKSTRERAFGPNNLQYEEWIAPDLGCLVLQSTVTKYQNGAPLVRKETEVITLKPGEPDPATFQWPAAFVERKPSEVMSELARRKGTSCTECELRSGPILDKIYGAHH